MYKGVCAYSFSLLFSTEERKSSGCQMGSSWTQHCESWPVFGTVCPPKWPSASTWARANVSGSLKWNLLLSSGAQPDVPFIAASIAYGPSVLEIHKCQGQTRALQYLVCMYRHKGQNLSSNNSHIEHTTVWRGVFFAGKKLCVNLKYANDEESTTCQHKLFQWLISTHKNVNFIFTYFNELSSLWLYFCSFELI